MMAIEQGGGYGPAPGGQELDPDGRTVSDGADTAPVTVVVSRQIRPGCETAFEDWLAGVTRVAARFPGHLGVTVLRPPARVPREYVLIFRFDRYENLRRWNESTERADWLERVRPFTLADPRVEVLTGLEHWFTLPDLPAAAPPPRHKMALLTWIAIFPLVLVIGGALEAPLAGAPRAFRTLLMTGLLVLLMTYIVMPRLTRLCARWLFGRRA